MAASMAERVRQAAGSWRRSDSMQASANPADLESVTVRYLTYVLLPAVTSLIAVPYAEELWHSARARKR